jgi:hypothetical protein
MNDDKQWIKSNKGLTPAKGDKTILQFLKSSIEELKSTTRFFPSEAYKLKHPV